MKKIIMKTIKIFLITILVAIISVVIYMIWIGSTGNIEHKSEQKILNSNIENPKKALIIYEPSRTNILKDVVSEIARAMNENNYEVTINYPGSFLSKDLSNYSIVVFGSPIYMGQPSKILMNYISSIENYSDKVVLFTVGASEDTKDIDILKTSLNSTETFAINKFITSDKSIKESAYNFGEKIIGE